jgi:dTDP-4-amino-4,6-dideoxygalactose transaminase
MAMVSDTSHVTEHIRAALIRRFHAHSVALTDSGTSALVLALRLAAGPSGTVAYPAYVCADLIAAARFVGVRVRLYDVNPQTLSPDLDSLRRVAAEGVDAIVVANLYGFPVDILAVRAIAAEHGITVIEDAAQHAGATVHGKVSGSFGDLTVLSFGRGKGMTAGSGGALLAISDRWLHPVEDIAGALATPARGAAPLIATTAAWILGRPWLYAAPSSIPALHLGETVYHDAHDPHPLSRAATALLATTLIDAEHHIELRRQHATVLRAAAVESARLRAVTAIQGGVPGYLRFPIVTANEPTPAPALGIVRGYPRPLNEQPELQPILLPSSDTFPGAATLAAKLLTIPTHHLVTPRDLTDLTQWLRTA